MGDSKREEQFARIWSERVTGCDPVREYWFAKHLKRKWRFDFAWPDLKVAVEIEGGTFSRGGGRHGRGGGHHKDCDKYNRATILGWKVLRFSSVHLTRTPDDVVDLVAEAMGVREVDEED